MKGLMQAAVLYAPADLKIKMVKIPEIGDKDVLVKVRATGVCGSDLNRIMKTGTYSFPTIPGHEFSGEVVETGSLASKFKISDRVVVAPLIPCFKCEYCQNGDFGQCIDYDFLGSRTDGGFAEYVRVPEKNLIILPDKISFIEGALIEPAAVTLHGIKKVGINVGDTVAVLGCGAIGLFAIQFAKIIGATKVIAVDIAEDKLELAKEIGADECINGTNIDVVQAIKDLTCSSGVNVAVETAGVSMTQEQCLRVTKKQGRILYLGTSHRDVIIPPKSFENIVRNEITIVGSWNSYSAPFPGVEWTSILEFIKSGNLNMKPLITNIFTLVDAPLVIKNMSERKFSFTKSVFEIN